MFRTKRSDTTVGAIEDMYGIDLNARRDALLGNLLSERGFDSQTQLLQAHAGRATSHARRRRLFLSFHAEDRAQVSGFRLLQYNSNVDPDFYDGSVREPVASDRSSYVRTVIREKIRACSVLVCLIGNGTAWRDWVDWEIQTAYDLRKGVCGVRLKGSVGRRPQALLENGAFVASWEMTEIVAAIEWAAARRS